MSINVHPRISAYVGGGVGRRVGACSPRATGRGIDVTDVCGVSGCNVSGPRRQRPRVALSADRKVSVVQCHSTVMSTAATSAGRNVSVARRQRVAASERAMWARRYVRAPKRQRGAKLVYNVIGEEKDRSCETTVPGTDSSKYKNTSVSGVPLFWADPRNFWSSTMTGLLALRVTNSQL